MSLLAVLGRKTDVPEVKQPLKLHTFAQTIEAPIVSFPTSLSPITNASPIASPLTVTPASGSLRLIGQTVGDRLLETHSYEFTTNSSIVNFRLASGTGNASKSFRVYVNGSPVESYVFPPVSSQYAVTFPSPGNRTIRVDLGKGVELQDVQLVSGSSVAPTVKRTSLYILGDSWIEGAGYEANGNTSGLLHMGFIAGRLLGADTLLGGAGGTGYANGAKEDGSGGNYAGESRIGRIISQQPDYLVIFGTINDGLAPQGSGTTLGKTIGDYATIIFNTVKARSPKTKILVVGVEDWNTTPRNPALTNTTASPTLTAAVNAATNVIGYVHPTVENWGATAGFNVNNTQYNSNHLTVPGNRYYGFKVAEFVARVLSLPNA